MPNIVITGPESTGKSLLAEQLANHYNGVWVPEYAREYFQNRNELTYDVDDVEFIARMQYNAYLKHSDYDAYPVFYDTYLIITKIWFEWVYKLVPVWLHNAIIESNIDLYILCDIDIEWTPDYLRTNGGEKRLLLFHRYKQELEYYKKKYVVVSGFDDARLKNAIVAVDKNVTF